MWTVVAIKWFLQLWYNFYFLFPGFAIYFCDMRFYLFIMAFWMLGLSCIPCMDAGQKSNQGKTNTEIGKSLPCQDDQEDECPPFCSCSCCSFSSINQLITISLSLPGGKNNSFESYLPENTTEIYLPVWQPPHLV